ncbi:MAG: hypothetical protein C0504_06765 [Candidatus Solibacter sp.]|nr:hypothetical protein [Candidatus Solibacter sp.]
MRRTDPGTLALAVLTGVVLLLGSAGSQREAAPLRPRLAEQLSFRPSAVFSEGWIMEFDLKRELTINRLNGKMDELRRKLEQRERSARFRLASHA